MDTVKARRIELAATSHAMPVTRMFVQSTMRAWGLQVMSERVERAAVHLVRSAVIATGAPEDVPLYKLDELNLVVVRIRLNPRDITVDVWDSSSEPPTGTPPVGCVSGFTKFDGEGKVVWAAVAYLEEGAPHPRRGSSPIPPPSSALDFVTDTGTLRRFYDGLVNFS